MFLLLVATFIAVALLTNFALFILIKKINKNKKKAFVLYQSSINLKISIHKLLHRWNFLALQKGKACLN